VFKILSRSQVFENFAHLRPLNKLNNSNAGDILYPNDSSHVTIEYTGADLKLLAHEMSEARWVRTKPATRFRQATEI